MRSINKKIKFLGIIFLVSIVFISWRGIGAPSRTETRIHANFQGKADVLQVSSGSGSYDSAVLTYNLNAYSGQRITVEVSMDVWLENPGNILWQVNNIGFPTIVSAGGLSAKTWHTVQGSSALQIESNRVLYLSSSNFDNNTAYFANLTVKINGDIVNKPVVIDTTLTAVHTKWPFPVGTVFGDTSVSMLCPERQLYRHFNVLVAGNLMKPDNVMSRPWRQNGAYRWTNSDIILNFAQANGQKVRGHVLFWHSQTPEAYFKGSGKGEWATIDELYTRMERHTRIMFEKFQGKVEWWDVVNEVVGEDGKIRAANSSGYTRIMEAGGKKGIERYEWVLKAFQWARQYADANGGQNVKLFLTEYNAEVPGAKHTEFLKLLDYLIANKAPIDGVGIQGHYAHDWPSVRDVSKGIDLFTAKKNPRTGANLIVHVCELDISIFKNSETKWGSGGASGSKTVADRELNTRLTQQGKRYREFFDMFEQKYKEGKLEMVLIWGASDTNSWLNFFPIPGRTEHPLLFDRDYQPKPAYYELIEGR